MKKHLAASALLVILSAAASPALADFATGMQSFRQGDYQGALREFTSDDSAESKYYLSMMLERGYGTGQNRSRSLELLKAAAERGLDVAQADLGLLYLEGRGVPRDEREGMKWLELAAAQGLVEAQGALRMAALR